MSKKTYKQLKNELEKVLDRLQDPQTDIDEALRLHEEGKKLIDQLEAYLDDVEQKVGKASSK